MRSLPVSQAFASAAVNWCRPTRSEWCWLHMDAHGSTAIASQHSAGLSSLRTERCKQPMRVTWRVSRPRHVLLLSASGLSLLSLVVGAFTLHPVSGAGAASPHYAISGNTPGFIKHATDQGALDPATVLVVMAWLKLHHTHQLDQMLAS